MMNELGAIDGWLERAYGRLGWRILLAYQAVVWLAGLALGMVITLMAARFARLTDGETLELVGFIALTWLVAAFVGNVLALRSARPLIAWIRSGRPHASAGRAWEAAIRLPRDNPLWNLIGVALVGPVGTWLALRAVMPLDFGDSVGIVLVDVLAALTGGTAAVFTAQLVVRPIVRDIAGRLDRPALGIGMTVRRKLLVAVPTVMCGISVLGAFTVLPTGADIGSSLDDVLVPGAFALLFGVPIALLLGYSTLGPLDDLMRATERLKRGDFASRVPELSADEHGALAHSFNDAMEALERFATENERLLGEAHASRSRIVTASDAERRRVERNLHDGAQQRLVALALRLRMIEDQVARDPKLSKMVAEASHELSEATDDLRELARGLHPQVLSAGGLGPALEQLADRAPVPVKVSATTDRYSEPVESTAYFVASEALANVAKYSRAKHAEVSAERRNGRLLLAISDDGVGGADPDSGSGLTGLADRIAALDGKLTVESPRGEGTTVLVDLPLESQNAAKDQG